MRLSTIVACLLLISPPSALACIEHAAEQTGWLHETPSAYRHFAGEGAEASSMLGLSLLGAGSASLALVFVAFRALSRAQGRSRPRPVGSESDDLVEPSAPLMRPGAPWLRIDPGHEPLEPAGAGRGEETLSGALAMH